MNLNSKSMRKFFVVVTFVLAMVPGRAEDLEKYAGVEFLGSSQITKLELEKSLGLRAGASLPSVDKAVERLRQKLEARHLVNNIEIVAGGPGQVFVSVDVLDSSSPSIPNRRLIAPRHVNVRSEKPFLLLEKLHERLEKVTDLGGSNRVTYQDGVLHYTDEPANQIVEEILAFAPLMRQELIAVVQSDPDPKRRIAAIELLEFAGSVPETAASMVDAVDDSDPKVRAMAVRYLFPRLSLLPDDFNFERMIEAASRLIERPSHEARSKGLYLLLALAKRNVLFVRQIKELDEKKLQELGETSVLPSIQTPVKELQAIISQWSKGPI